MDCNWSVLIMVKNLSLCKQLAKISNKARKKFRTAGPCMSTVEAIALKDFFKNTKYDEDILTEAADCLEDMNYHRAVSYIRNVVMGGVSFINFLKSEVCLSEGYMPTHLERDSPENLAQMKALNSELLSPIWWWGKPKMSLEETLGGVRKQIKKMDKESKPKIWYVDDDE